MDCFQKLRLLSRHMDVEHDEEKSDSPRKTLSIDHIQISHATMPNGKRLRLLKTALTSACENNCFYCAFHSKRDFIRATFNPHELAKTFVSLYDAGLVQGFFISSGIINGGIFTQDRLIDIAEILRYKFDFRGYIHLKIMPGAEFDQVFRSMQLADRVSINLEAPNIRRLSLIAPRKEYERLMNPIKWIDHIRQTSDPHQGWGHRWPSSSTQFVIGASGESDWEILSTTESLYHNYHLKRAYFSKFTPISGTPLAELPGESPIRELRLYQASFLLRDYGFTLPDIPLNKDGYMPRNSDPKYHWAKLHLSEAPIEINQAEKQDLLHIPGIGPKSANSIIKERRIQKFTSINDLKKLGINTNRISQFILLNGKKPPYQPSFTSFDS